MTYSELIENEAVLLWRALDRIAERRGMSMSAFAKAAGKRWGNPAYRISPVKRTTVYPYMRTLAEIMLHHGVSWSELGATIDTIKLGQAAENGLEEGSHDIAA